MDRPDDRVDRSECLEKENARLLDELEKIYTQFLMLKQETEVSYAQLRARNATLEQKVEEIQRAYAELEVARNQLIHSERLAAMGQLAASIVHELNNPLMIIIGYLDMALSRERLGDQESREYVSVARQYSESMMQLVRDILNFSRKQMASSGEIHINELLGSVVGFLKNILKRRVTDFEWRLAPDLPATSGSGQELQQVFTNILTNAADAMPGRGKITIVTDLISAQDVKKRVQTPGVVSAVPSETVDKFLSLHEQFIQIDFTDSGTGMPEDILTSIFNPFFTTKPPGKGTGLGLSICRTIVERHQGALTVSSALNRGTTFSLFLPVCAPAGS